jgi:hypothetical protein
VSVNPSASLNNEENPGSADISTRYADAPFTCFQQSLGFGATLVCPLTGESKKGAGGVGAAIAGKAEKTAIAIDKAAQTACILFMNPPY